MARKLFDIGIFNALTSGAALGSGWKLHFYTAATTTPITTYNARTAGSANANPVVADANGRFGKIWLDGSQTIKWVLADSADVVKVTVDDYLIDAVAASPDTDLTTFLADASANPLPVALGGTGSTSAANAATALAVLPVAGGTMTGNIVRSGKGIHPYFNDAAMTSAKLFVQAAGSDPTANPGDIVFEY